MCCHGSLQLKERGQENIEITLLDKSDLPALASESRSGLTIGSTGQCTYCRQILEEMRQFFLSLPLATLAEYMAENLRFGLFIANVNSKFVYMNY